MAAAIAASSKTADDLRERFTDLYSAVWRELYRYAYYCVGTKEDAEEVLQEAALRGYKGMSGLRDESAFRAWMYRIVSVCCKNKIAEIAAIRREHSGDDDLAALNDGSGSDIDLAITLKLRLMALKVDERRMVLLSVIGGYTSAEIAEIMEYTPGSVRSKLSRTLRKLRETM